MLSRHTKILLLDCLETVRLAGAAGYPDDDTLVVAVTSEAMSACEEARIPYKSLDHWSAPNDIESLGWKNYESLEQCCKIIDSIISNSTIEILHRNILPARHSFYDIKMSMDSISIKLFMINKLFESTNIKTVICCFVKDSVFEKVTRLLEKKADCKFTYINCIQKPKKQIYKYISTVKNLIILIKMIFSKKRIIKFNDGHDIKYIIPLIKFNNINIIDKFINIRWKGYNINNSWIDMVCSNKLIINYFMVCGISYIDLIREIILMPLSTQLQDAVAAYDSVKMQTRLWPVSFCLTGSINVGLIQRSQMLAAQHNGAPLVTYQEGAGYGSIVTPIYDYTEVNDGDLFLAYGDGNAEYYSEKQWTTKPFITVGSCHQDSIRRNKKVLPHNSIKNFTVLYVGTIVSSDRMHCPNNGLVDTYYFSKQIDIYNVLAKLPVDVNIRARIHPADGASRRLLSSARYQKIELEDRPFEEAMWDADLIIIDFPSTVLLSSCLTKAKLFVLVLPGVSGLTKTQEKRLSSRAHVFNSMDSLIDAIGNLSFNRNEPQLDGTDYLRAYSLPDENGHVAERVADLLCQINGQNWLLPRSQKRID